MLLVQEDITREAVVERFKLPNPFTQEGSFALKHEYEGMPLVCFSLDVGENYSFVFHLIFFFFF